MPSSTLWWAMGRCPHRGVAQFETSWDGAAEECRGVGVGDDQLGAGGEGAELGVVDDEEGAGDEQLVVGEEREEAPGEGERRDDEAHLAERCDER
jgi:hypothetical protein